MEHTMDQWIESQIQLLDWERDEEISQLTDKITSLSSKACQSEGLSLLNLEIESSRSALFGRCCLTLQRSDKQQLVQSFKAGDEVSLYNPKLYMSGGKSNEDAILMGLIGKVTQFKVEMIVDEFDDHLFEAPLRMDLRSSQKTHTTMKAALNVLKHEGRNNPLVSLLFSSEGEQRKLLPNRIGQRLETSTMWNHNLNDSQLRAVQCALDTPSVAIIHGPPGTGKTSTLTELILQAVNRDLKVLVCAPSNIAVDTILARLDSYRQTSQNLKGNSTAGPVLKNGLNMVRVGHPARISENIMKYALDSIISNDEATEIVKDVRNDIDKLRCEMSKKGRRKIDREDGISIGQIRREQRQELRSLCKEARQRERDVVTNVLKHSNVVLSTCVGAGSRLLNQMEFDMVIIDEAAQGLEVACWIPILKLKDSGGVCVLAGDHCQLPPTIKSAQAEKGGLSITLFERIIRDPRFGLLVTLLDTQYRMNRRISDWASHNMYHDAIQSHPSVAEHTLRDIIYPQPTKALEGSETAEDCDVYPVLLLVDTSGLGMFEDSQLNSTSTSSESHSATAKKSGSSSHRNFHEAELIKQHVLSLVRSGVKPNQIGVITPYNGQLEVLRDLLFPPSEVADVEKVASSTNNGKIYPVKAKPKVQNPLVDEENAINNCPSVNLEGLEIKTIDGFQGGEKECILLSLVRSNMHHNVGFLGDKRRINVAVTRAKRHLAVFCDADTCCVDAFMCTLIDHMSSEGDHISAEEYSDYVTSGGYGNAFDGVSPRTRSNKPALHAKKSQPRLMSTIEKSDFITVMEKFKSGTLLAVNTSKTAVVNIIIPEETQSESVSSMDKVTARLYCATGVLRFPSSMQSYLRLLVHECAELLGLRHRSMGEGSDRYIEVTAGIEFPEDVDPTFGKKKKVKKQNPPAPLPSSRETTDVPAEEKNTAIVDTTVLESSPVVEDAFKDHSHQIKQSNKFIGALDTGNSSDEDRTEVHPVNALPKSTPKKKPTPKKATSTVYMSADRRSALGRLEEQHEKNMRNAELDDDALLDAAINHNQKLSELHKYRVGSTAMPNPDKVAAREKLQNKVAEAALARMKATNSSNNQQQPAGGLGTNGTGRLGGNVFGFTNSNSSAPATASGTGSGSKKKVVKKPPPNFGGGVLGKK